MKKYALSLNKNVTRSAECSRLLFTEVGIFSQHSALNIIELIEFIQCHLQLYELNISYNTLYKDILKFPEHYLYSPLKIKDSIIRIQQ